jgi:CubicO group peptidase (beta-lactamase class C family)
MKGNNAMNQTIHKKRSSAKISSNPKLRTHRGKSKAFAILAFILLFPLWSCEGYDDDLVFPASDFIAEGKFDGNYWPTGDWRSCAPEEVGMDPLKLKELNEEIRLLLEMQIEIHNLLIVKDGYIVAEQYYSEEYGPEDLHRIYSCTKSITSTLLGIASGKGQLGSLDQKALDFFPELDIKNRTPEKESINLRHLLTMSAGLEWYEMEYPYGDSRNTFFQWNQAGGGVEYVLNLAMAAAPGTEYAYSTGVSHILSSILQKVTGTRADSFALKHLFEPLGIQDYYWPVDNEGVAYGGSGLRMTPRDLARVGYLYLNEGTWDGKEIVPSDWIRSAHQKHMARKYIPDNYYGYQFWVSDYGPYSAVGFGGQWLTIVPEHNLVVVMNNRFAEGESFQWNTPERLLTTYILPAVE